MKILFIPHPSGGISHFIPLVRLYQLLAPDVKSAFFLSETLIKLFGDGFQKRFKINILKNHNKGTIASEIAAYHSFQPDIIIDDTNLATAYVRQIKHINRITIMRTGIFPNIKPRNPSHTHSMGHSVEQMPNVEQFGFEPYREFSDFFEAEAKIIPGIQSIEMVDESFKEDQKCWFSGPLLVDDFDRFLTSELRLFIERNDNRKTVYITYGMTEEIDSPDEIVEFIEYALSQGVAVITNVGRRKEKIAATYPDTYLQEAFFPMNYVLSHVEGVFHHCGSGAYHYPLIHNMFSVILGTQRYDRDDVAIQLERLGVAKYVPSPKENPSFLDTLKEELDRIILQDGEVNSCVKSKILSVKSEIEERQKNFNFMDVLNSLC